MTWRAAIETTQDFRGQVRAVGFGEVDGITVLAVGAGTEVRIWDPRAGVVYPRAIANDQDRVIAVGLGTHRGRSVVAISSYEGGVVIRDLRSGEVVRRIDEGAVSSVCLARVDDRPVVAGASSRAVRWWDPDTGDLLGERDFGDLTVQRWQRRHTVSSLS